MTIVEDDLSGEQIRALLSFHLAEMARHSPPDGCFALDLAALRDPSVTLWSAWDGAALLGCAALQQLTRTHGEIKSMRTATEHLGKGVGMALLEHIIGVAARRGYRRLSLETGSGPAFDAALALYRKRGFVTGGPFGGHAGHPGSVYLHLDL